MAKASTSWALGVDLGGTKIRVGHVTDEGQLVAVNRVPTDVSGGPEQVIAQIVAESRKLWQKKNPPAALGIGVAGQINGETGDVIFGPNLDWHNVPLRAELEKALDIPCHVLNDVRAAAYGEWQMGAGQGATDLICCFVGTGVGGGIIVGGRMLTGASNSAGEIGHTVVDINGPRCTCGNTGCLEALAGGWAIARAAQLEVADDFKEGQMLIELAGGGTAMITAKHVTKAAQAGDPLAMRLATDALRALGAGLSGLVNAFNPSHLIIGGGVGRGLPDAVPTVQRIIRERSLSAATRHLRVLPAALGSDSGVIGSALYALDEE